MFFSNKTIIAVAFLSSVFGAEDGHDVVPCVQSTISVLQHQNRRNASPLARSGPGFKTVLPSEAIAKLSFHLVGTQDPDRIQAAFRDFVTERLPADCSVSYHSKNNSGATVMPLGDPIFEKARAALSDEWPNEAVFVGGGGSIPVVGHFLIF